MQKGLAVQCGVEEDWLARRTVKIPGDWLPGSQGNTARNGLSSRLGPITEDLKELYFIS